MTAATETRPLEWSDLWAAMKAAPADWIATTDAMYDTMLGCVPPRAQRGGAFLVGEADSHNATNEAVYACFLRRRTGDVVAQYMTACEFSAWMM
jgi:hypothetical protein